MEGDSIDGAQRKNWTGELGRAPESDSCIAKEGVVDAGDPLSGGAGAAEREESTRAGEAGGETLWRSCGREPFRAAGEGPGQQLRQKMAEGFDAVLTWLGAGKKTRDAATAHVKFLEGAIRSRSRMIC
eukprot:s469_g41.t1